MNYWVEQLAKDYEVRNGIKFYLSIDGRYAMKTSPMGLDVTYRLNKCSNRGDSNGNDRNNS